MRSGFTLVELIASFSIIVIIALGVLIQFRTLSSTQTLENGVDVVRSVFLQARTSAITGQTCCSSVTTPAGYGVYIQLDGVPDNTLVWFADSDNDQTYTSSDTVLSETILTDDVHLTSCDDGTTTTTTDSCTLVFVTPGFSGLYYNGTTATTELTWTFYEESSGSTQSVVIYPLTYVVE